MCLKLSQFISVILTLFILFPLSFNLDALGDIRDRTSEKSDSIKPTEWVTMHDIGQSTNYITNLVSIRNGSYILGGNCHPRYWVRTTNRFS